MNASALMERLGRLPRTQRLLMFGVVYVLIAVVWWFMLYSPASASIETKEAENVKLRDQKRQVERRAFDRPKFEAELQELMAELQQALQELPNAREIPDLLKGISNLGKNVGLEIRSFTPQPEVKRDYVAEVPVALEVTGTYHEIAMFFDRLSKMNRIVYVRDIDMSSPTQDDGKVRLDVTGTAVTFRFLSDAEAGGDEKRRVKK